MFRAIGIACLACLVGAPSAAAAMTARLSLETASPRAGSTVAIALRPYWPYARADGSCCRLVAADVDYPFRLQALGPRGAWFRFRPTRTADRFAYRARVHFPSPGRWEIRIENFYRSPRDAAAAVRYGKTAPRLVVRVRPR